MIATGYVNAAVSQPVCNVLSSSSLSVAAAGRLRCNHSFLYKTSQAINDHESLLIICFCCFRAHSLYISLTISPRLHHLQPHIYTTTQTILYNVVVTVLRCCDKSFFSFFSFGSCEHDDGPLGSCCIQ